VMSEGDRCGVCLGRDQTAAEMKAVQIKRGQLFLDVARANAAQRGADSVVQAELAEALAYARSLGLNTEERRSLHESGDRRPVSHW